MEKTLSNDVEVPLIESLEADEIKVKVEQQTESKKQTAKDTHNEETEEVHHEAPDGGWGWCVVVGTTICMMMMSTQGPCFGIFYGERLRELGASPSLAAWLFNAQSLIWNVAGPWAGLLSEKFGYRPVAMVAAGIAVSSLILSAVVPNPYLLLLTFSTFSGVGGGICINCCYQLTAKYFKRRLGLANGIMVTGGSLGLILLPQMASLLQRLYTFEWATLIAGAVMMNVLAATLLFHPVEWHYKKRIPEPNENGITSCPVSPEHQKLMTHTSGLALDMPSKIPSEGFPRCSSVPLDLLDRDIQNNNENPLLSPKRKRAMSECPCKDGWNQGPRNGFLLRHDLKKSKMSVHQYGGSTLMGSVLTLSQKQQHLTGENGDVGRPRKDANPGIWQKFLSNYQPSVLRDPLVISVALLTCITITAALNMFSTMPFVLNDAGYSLQSAASAMSSAALADLVMRTVCATITDRSWVNVRLLYGTAQVIFIVVPYVLISGSSHWWLVILCMCTMGIGLGILYVLDVFIIVRLLGVQKLQSVFGMSQLFRAFTFMSLGPIGGVLRDITGSYTSTILFYSSAIFLALLIMFFTAFYTSCRSRHSIQAPDES